MLSVISGRLGAGCGQARVEGGEVGLPRSAGGAQKLHRAAQFGVRAVRGRPSDLAADRGEVEHPVMQGPLNTLEEEVHEQCHRRGGEGPLGAVQGVDPHACVIDQARPVAAGVELGPVLVKGEVGLDAFALAHSQHRGHLVDGCCDRVPVVDQ
jgi:hypothetical protein